MHSPVRTLMYTMELRGVPQFVSEHFVRHTQGIQHFVQSKRDDLSKKIEAAEVTRETPRVHGMLMNAESFINLAKARLCFKAHSQTRLWMAKIIKELEKIEPHLARRMVPNCVFRAGICPEHNGGCTHLKFQMHKYSDYLNLALGEDI